MLSESNDAATEYRQPQWAMEIKRVAGVHVTQTFKPLCLFYYLLTLH